MSDILAECQKALREKAPALAKIHYRIPPLWVDPTSRQRKPVVVNPLAFLADKIEQILRQPAVPLHQGNKGEWSRLAVVYNLMVRTALAFDHSGDGELALPLNRDGLRETGTFLKAMALLPYIQYLGANTVHLLPITAIGHDGNKGNLGSPYAIRNPYELDEMQGEPASGLGLQREFRAFVAAAHHLGIRVVLEFAFRTAAKDSDWVAEHPEWFYWIREDIANRSPGSQDEHLYGSPVFTAEELTRIKGKVTAGSRDELPPPHPIYREMFATPPGKENVRLEGGRYLGIGSQGQRLRIPGAFADWPPDDTQPPWNDVTYLRLYDHPEFNYIAYNTLRMYDNRLAQSQYAVQSLWDKIVGIVPHYQKEFDIDGVMIDMGHALPIPLKQRIITVAREERYDFAFWDEKFAIEAGSRQEGYNAVMGYLWCDQARNKKHRQFLQRLGAQDTPIPFFATPENHNTPRAAARPGGKTYSRLAWLIDNFLPGIPFIHAGFELGETFPINTGLDFQPSELSQYPSEKLPLFSAYAYPWLAANPLVEWLHRVSRWRREYAEIVVYPAAQTFHWVETGQQDVVAFIRTTPQGTPLLCIVANLHCRQRRSVTLDLPTPKQSVQDALTERVVSPIEGKWKIDLAKGEGMVLFL